MELAAIVLVPGSWTGAWAWEDVPRELRAAGHEVYPVALSGLADRVAEAAPEPFGAAVRPLDRPAALPDIPCSPTRPGPTRCGSGSTAATRSLG